MDLKKPTYLKSPTERIKNTTAIPKVSTRNMLRGTREPSQPSVPEITRAAVNKALATMNVENFDGMNNGFPSTLGTPTPFPALPATAQ